ncbi:hypothetical protein WS71_30850 [Burkholderia mayonis]|uniref:Uncharacterized protein n=1 Tax=Burkholderia mayonis TaxID=1385591 RepID=A0A1B4G6A6_9BURK|nr:hypothetical protein WS71_30850 [Burkholderia mayonis]KVE46432.1 hypothetical protein WS71_22015 [Burkholderia mayonis]
MTDFRSKVARTDLARTLRGASYRSLMAATPFGSGEPGSSTGNRRPRNAFTLFTQSAIKALMGSS